MNIVIIKYNAGNIQSVMIALERIGVKAEVTDDIEKIQLADKVIFPGVGEAGSAMHFLKVRGMDVVIKSLRQPFLGICLGMQLMCKYSEENNTECLGIFDQQVKLFQQDNEELKLKIPQVGWNNIYDLKSPLFNGVEENAYCYFIHSYYAGIGQHTIAKTSYNEPYSSAMQKDNFYGVQFHPEKSAAAGDKILKNFMSI